jgi:threonine dehydrogenase-like Zn-dependent dehydrogenase
LVEPLSCAVHCHNLADVKESDYVVIIGAGPMGLIIGSIVRKHPIKKLIYIELDEWRGKKALELGADLWINPNTQNVEDEIQKYTDNNGADVIIDAVGIAETFEIATSIWASGARLVCFGQDYSAEARIKPNEIVRHQRKIIGSYIGYPQDFLDAIELIANGVIDVEKLISHRIRLKDLSKGFDLMKEKKCIKIIVNL